MHDPEQEPGQHQADRHLRIDPRPAVVTTVNVGDLAAQPGEIQIAIDPDQDVIVGHELAERAGDEQLQLIALFAPKHAHYPALASAVNQGVLTTAKTSAPFLML